MRGEADTLLHHTVSSSKQLAHMCYQLVKLAAPTASWSCYDRMLGAHLLVGNPLLACLAVPYSWWQQAWMRQHSYLAAHKVAVVCVWLQDVLYQCCQEPEGSLLVPAGART